MLDVNLNDIKLYGGQDYVLTATGDLEIASGTIVTVESAIRRILTWKGSWSLEDPDFGSELHVLLAMKTPSQITNDEVYDIVLDALLPMLQDGRLTALDEVTILQASRKTLQLRIIMTVNGKAFSTVITQQL